MLLSLIYLFVRRFLRLLIPGDEIVRTAEVELLVEHYNVARPHRALGLDTPEAGPRPASAVRASRILRRDRLGGLIREYEVAA